MTSRLSAALLSILLAVSVARAQTADPAPRNIILMIADGCGFNHLRAASLWQDGAELFPAWDDLPVRLAVSTYAEGGGYDPASYWSSGPEGMPATDSAAAITALTTGHKTRNGWLARTADGTPLTTLVDAMERGGRSTGVVTSVEFAHATPAGCAVSAPKRSAYLEISRDMITRSSLDVIMGTGHPLHDRQGRSATESITGTSAARKPGRTFWPAQPAATPTAMDAPIPGPWCRTPKRSPRWPRARPRRASSGSRACARRCSNSARATRWRAPFVEPPLPDVPTLQDMALGALNVLDADPDGFFLMIEGGAIDWAAHDNQPGRLIEEVVAFAADGGSGAHLDRRPWRVVAESAAHHRRP